ncbi:Peroxisomal membrane protein PEX29 [Emericellopsis cladophorae]|uniref:Peroxisomal membrane protein PEX29 n=1 Tax=Emericellopsis cladophorae TaxID=2686198 RepID=A0A9P9Y6U1_9HYPO|nr:Peroxisomal membrane protein PEX29 [Emericellopsis cladophorae]KAI6784368.1 Peroxisomal membrane protein PEX29 [Emericellopsis cladophorae]
MADRAVFKSRMDEFTAEYLAREQHDEAQREKEQPHPMVDAEPTTPTPKARLRTGFATFREKASVQDRLVEKLLQQVIPTDDEGSDVPIIGDDKAPAFAQRPNFNITTMSNNFRRFNARIGVVFKFQSKALRILSWHQPSQTMSLLAVYTFICLDPYLLSVVPIAILVVGVLIPAFLARHPAPPKGTLSSEQGVGYSPRGPPLAPAPTVRPVKELSKDFFRNMRDLQNCIGMGHPTIARLLVATHEEHIQPRKVQARTWLDNWIANDVILDSAPETREVEVFELQRMSDAGEWEPWLFTPSPYDPLSQARITGDRPRGARFFEDVLAPEGWEWSEKKWALDLWSREWVEERIITGVEVETEGERWVYDMHDEREEQVGVVEAPQTSKLKVLPQTSWQEGEDAVVRRGDWRRRRWVRLVKRRVTPAFTA